jgi:uncharacterized protein YutE (UPF0331/DUF86 family)
MDTLTFIAEIIKAVIWPLTIIGILVILRKPILNYFPAIEKLKYGDWELDFAKQVHKLAKEAKESLDSALSKFDDATQDDYKKLLDIAQVSPRAALLEAWMTLESVAFQVMKQKDPKLTTTILKTPLQFGITLEKQGIINCSQKEIFDKLRNLRNAAAHAMDFAFDTRAAIEYAEMALNLVNHIRIQSINKGSVDLL